MAAGDCSVDVARRRSGTTAETALNGDTLSGESRQVVERVYQSVRSGHDQMSQLKHGMETSTHA